MTYSEFLKSKRQTVVAGGKSVSSLAISRELFPFQRDLTRWAIAKGRAAIFADTGLGKTRMQLEWARLIADGPVLIVAPLSVARQTIREGEKIGVVPVYSRDGSVHDLTITNYEMVSAFDPKQFSAVVLDESSILKSLDGKTRKKLTEMFSRTTRRLCCTATPAPNDIAEIANHAEFLGICSRVDMLATFFVHDDEGWRLKGHASDVFYRWLASWGMSIRFPSDLGYDDDGFILPELTVEPVFVPMNGDIRPRGRLFWTGKLDGISERSQVRQATIESRLDKVVELVAKDGGQWLLWCGLNAESDGLAKRIGGSVPVSGSDPPERKAEVFEAFQDGQVRVLVTKPRIAGFGMNFQNCHRMAFVGLSDSWEAYYQCVRRCYRFGQKKPVHAWIVLSEAEQTVYKNVMRKQQEADVMARKLVQHVKEFEKRTVHRPLAKGSVKLPYKKASAKGKGWEVLLGDSAERLSKVKSDSVGLSVFSPPFLSLYVYSATARDLGNSETAEQFWKHFSYITKELLRVTMPGRNCCVHVSQVASVKAIDGYIGLKDLRGDCIGHFKEHGWIYHGDVCIDKDPQIQAIRTHAKTLLFVQLKKDAAWLRPGLADYILVFRKDGDNPEPVKPDITNDQWVEWAHPVWYGINETDTLNVKLAREEKDERHICPLQLGVIERCVRLWSNEGDLVLSPFAGIGSEGYVALQLRRRFLGVELKPSYYKVAVANLRDAERRLWRKRLV
jgi:DNA modification methylase/superfamily II DNA or RNA helicase